jgi:hypothetical protein
MGDDEKSRLHEKARAIANKQPGHKFAYRLKCKLKFELNRFSYRFHSPEVNSLEQQKFPKIHLGHPTFSETLQDLFVLRVTQGKKSGTYLEIGSGPAIINNNTYLLEKYFGWRGLSIDLNSTFVKEFKEIRNNLIYCADATTFDYSEKLSENKFPKFIDYLQIDIDPSYQSLMALFQIPFEKYTFATITFEHDLYRSNSKIAKIAREKLESEGYLLVVKNVFASKHNAYEDWWVHPEMVREELYVEIISENKKPSELLK